jgi:hypothetical protein
MEHLKSLHNSIDDALTVINDALPIVVLINVDEFEEVYQWLIENNITYYVKFVQEMAWIEFDDISSALWCKLIFGRGRY